jgi:hypothetical protein
MFEGNVEPFPKGKNHFFEQLEGDTFVVWKGYSLGQYNRVLMQFITNFWATSMQHICLGEMAFPRAHTTISLRNSKYLQKEKPFCNHFPRNSYSSSLDETHFAQR